MQRQQPSRNLLILALPLSAVSSLDALMADPCNVIVPHFLYLTLSVSGCACLCLPLSAPVFSGHVSVFRCWSLRYFPSATAVSCRPSLLSFFFYQASSRSITMQHHIRALFLSFPNSVASACSMPRHPSLPPLLPSRRGSPWSLS